MTKSDTVKTFSETPISFNYKCPSQEMIEELFRGQALTVLENSERLILNQTYYKMNLLDAKSRTFTRVAIENQLKKALAILGPSFGFIVFDAFRSRQTQRALFDSVAARILVLHPGLSSSEVHFKTSKYIIHPDDKAGFPVPPHNSGGAIDLALCKNNQMLAFGSGFDDPSTVSSTSFFESEYDPQIGFSKSEWVLFRRNRRILFHTLTSLGFTNYKEEWWHYDLGDCMWAEEFKIAPVFQSLEAEVENYERVI